LRRRNYLAVEIDNRISSDTVPGFAMRQRTPHTAWYDWWDYGGMVRDVWLTLGGPIQVRRQQIRSRMEESIATVAGPGLFGKPIRADANSFPFT